VSYGLVGVFEAINGFFVYFVIMADHGFLLLRLFFLREQWEDKGVNDLEDSYGQEWVSFVFCTWLSDGLVAYHVNTAAPAK